MRIAVFGYGSLVSSESASLTLGREVGSLRPARLHGWRRRWSQARDNHAEEKTFELLDGTLPSHVLGLNVERGEDPAGPVNGALIELSHAELDRLDIREIRYERVEITDLVDPLGASPFDRVITYRSKTRNFAPEPAPSTVILTTYATTVERAFDLLGPGELDHYRASTGPYPVAVVDGRLTRDEAPPGNPRRW